MKRLFKWLLAVTMYYSGLLWVFRTLVKPFLVKNNLIILRYHRVMDNDQQDPINISVKYDSFRAQMQYVKKHFNVLDIEDIVYGLNEKKAFRAPTLGITFDDGYKNNYVFAFPVLRQLSLPAMIFVTVDYMNDHKTFSWDKEIWQKNELLAIQMLDWREIKHMSENKISFGSHTMTHPRLGEIDLEKARREINESKISMEAILGRGVDIFSYPHGSYNPEVRDMVKKAGYKAAFSSDSGFYNGKDDLFTLKRKAIHESLVTNPLGGFSRSMFALEVEGVFDLLLKWRRNDNG